MTFFEGEEEKEKEEEEDFIAPTERTEGVRLFILLFLSHLFVLLLLN